MEESVRAVMRYTKNLSKKQIEAYPAEMEIRDAGHVTEAGDGIRRASKVWQMCAPRSVVQFRKRVKALLSKPGQQQRGCHYYGEYLGIEKGWKSVQPAYRLRPSRQRFWLAVVVNALGEPIDGKGPIKFNSYRPIERIAPGVVQRKRC